MASKLSCLIVDDNPIARATLIQLVSQVADLELTSECCNAMEAYNYLQDNDVDILFLDIEMPEMNGIELTRNLKKKNSLIIFTTSKKEYAVEAFELNVADYLIKPFAPARFLQAVSKVRELLSTSENDIQHTGDEFIFVRDSTISRKVKFEDILYLEAMGDYVKFFTQQGMYAIHGTLKSIEGRLPANKFLRVHRSFIVAVNKIDTLENGGIVVKGKFVPVADSYRKTVNTRINVF